MFYQNQFLLTITDEFVFSCELNLVIFIIVQLQINEANEWLISILINSKRFSSLGCLLQERELNSCIIHSYFCLNLSLKSFCSDLTLEHLQKFKVFYLSFHIPCWQKGSLFNTDFSVHSRNVILWQSYSAVWWIPIHSSL